MQQLVGDTPGLADEALHHELFLLRLPATVRMVLASASSSTSLHDLAQMADRIVEASVPSVSAFYSPSHPNTSELDDLRSEIASLKTTIKSLIPLPLDHVNRNHMSNFAGIMNALEMLLISAKNPVPSREMARPTTSGNKWVWPESLSPILYKIVPLVFASWLIQVHRLVQSHQPQLSASTPKRDYTYKLSTTQPLQLTEISY